jgi:hypothetical protein
VYEPLEAFSAGERAHWAVYALRPDAGADADRLERAAAWQRLLSPAHAVLDPAVLDGAGVVGGFGDVLEEAGWFDVSLPDPKEPAMHRPGLPGLPGLPSDRQRAHARVLRLSGGERLLCPVPSPDRSLVRPWRLPVEWLLLVRPEDAVAGDATGHYVAAMSRCRTRAARVLRTLRRGLGELPVTAGVASTARWLEAFHPRSAVEVDLRSVTALVGEDGRDDVQLGLEAVVEGDAATMAAAYRRIRRRDEILRDISRAS